MLGDTTARSNKFHSQVIDLMTLVDVWLRFCVFSAATAMKIDCGVDRLPKAALGKAQSENKIPSKNKVTLSCTPNTYGYSHKVLPGVLT